ncbi:MAG: hypothetical protein LBQ95_08265 [Lachnospiraceae bacterium]|jgi:TrpR-related protein YerC/YecD|nr:hypothetical protein [Lachnospiraceae bacterium]
MINSKMRSKEVDELFDVLLLLKDREECYALFEDLATIGEVKALARRLAIAKRLYFDDETYAVIAEEFGISTTTIGRVKNSILYGSGGYKTVLDRIVSKENN